MRRHHFCRGDLRSPLVLLATKRPAGAGVRGRPQVAPTQMAFLSVGNLNTMSDLFTVSRAPATPSPGDLRHAVC